MPAPSPAVPPPVGIRAVPPEQWPGLATFIHRHNRRGDGTERCLHAGQGDTVEQHAHELAALAADEAAFWQAGLGPAREPQALIGCEMDAALSRAWLRGPLWAGDAPPPPGLLESLLQALAAGLPAIRCLDAFPAEDEPVLNALYERSGFRRLGVHRVMEAALAPVPAPAGPSADQPLRLQPPARIRRAEAADLPALLALHECLFPNGYLKPGDMADALQHPGRRVLAGLDADQRLVGYLHAKDEPEPPEVYIDYLGVAADARGRGVGQALLAEALAWGRALGRPRASLTVREDRSSALSLYERSGFRQVSAGVHWRLERDTPAPTRTA
jgi:ribosomal protein S18 acetylase RimI-like enzyme